MEQKKRTKGARSNSSGLPYGGDPAVDRNGISTESHMDIYRRLVKAGDQGMHGPPGDRRPRKS